MCNTRVRLPEIFLHLYPHRLFELEKLLKTLFLVYKSNMLNKDALNELKSLFSRHYDINLSDTELFEEASDLLYLYAFSQGKFHLLHKCVTLLDG
jgi:hypothetical protein